MSAEPPQVVLTRTCAATAECAYHVLSDLRSHLVWGGSRQRRMFRLLQIDGPTDPLVVGSVFNSTGTIPGSLRRWSDESVVIQAVHPRRLTFRTESTVSRGQRKPMRATYCHTYDIRPHEGGCLITYSFVEERTEARLLRLRLPLVRGFMWRYGIPLMMGRGFGHLIRAAEVSNLCEAVSESPVV